ncbi:hypothetical protein [Promicromonospora kroppenstedtii]|nr:hypothetical protein [Promicromonospora kroppenstedtii]
MRAANDVVLLLAVPVLVVTSAPAALNHRKRTNDERTVDAARTTASTV